MKGTTTQGGNHTLIPLSNAITEAKRYLKIQDTSDDDTLEILAWNAVRWIQPLSSFELQTIDVDVCNGKAELPNHCIRFLWFRGLYDEGYDGTICQQVNQPFLFNLGISIPQSSTLFQAFYRVQVINNYLDFGCLVDFDRVRIAFMGYHVDSQGEMLITDMVKMAITYKICAEYALMEYEKYGKVQQMYERKAMFAGNKVRSIDFSTDFREHKNEIGLLLRAYYYTPITTGITGAGFGVGYGGAGGLIS
jgi:hypothetical protein